MSVLFNTSLMLIPMRFNISVVFLDVCLVHSKIPLEYIHTIVAFIY